MAGLSKLITNSAQAEARARAELGKSRFQNKYKARFFHEETIYFFYSPVVCTLPVSVLCLSCLSKSAFTSDKSLLMDIGRISLSPMILFTARNEEAGLPTYQGKILYKRHL